MRRQYRYLMMTERPGDWWPCYSADETETSVRAKAAANLKVPEEQVEVKYTGGCWLARVKEKTE